jgi:hypothetical protein
MTWKTRTKPGEVLRITKLVNTNGVEIENDCWGIILDDEDMMLYIRRERDPRANKAQAHEGWSSRVCPIDYADEDSELAKADDIPEDVPADFWPLASQLQLAR